MRLFGHTLGRRINSQVAAGIEQSMSEHLSLFKDFDYSSDNDFEDYLIFYSMFMTKGGRLVKLVI